MPETDKEKKLDFTNMHIESLPDEEINVDTVKQHLYFLETRLETTWKMLDVLMSDERRPLVYKEWKMLEREIYKLFQHATQIRSIVWLMLFIVEKGIEDLNTFAQGRFNQVIAEEWFEDIMYYMGDYSIHNKIMREEHMLKLIDRLLPVAQAMRDENMVKKLALHRHPFDEPGQKLYAQAHINWQ